MNFIVLDLEWNSAYFKAQGRFINEIIQIGAVKLNEKIEIIDSFQVVIKSAISKKLSKRVIELTGITNERMNAGISFTEAVDKYNSWVGKDSVTMTWSDSDLFAIADNSSAFLKGEKTLKIEKYVDLQSYIQGELKILGNTITSQISLANAANMMGISTEQFDLHTAKDDAELSAIMLSKAYNSQRFNALIRDTSDPSFYKRLFFKPYYISNLKDKRINTNYLKFTCTQCKNRLTRTNRWKYKNNWFRAEFICNECSLDLKCMISFKQTFDKVVVKKRILPIVINEEGQKIEQMQQLPQKL